ncbi:hypothetical protein PBI_MRMAGOO_91 [Mycobacterium phage MrMagoo]|uniref:Uncharacterized protein n=1 Tax=Mycobacterium phage MrMagoo TaxID=1927020 RepID=A0A1L6BYL1_9CAUD|nr:hypothetical protein J4U04_gp091 [Mycobacterium phage MrMagoo]APQ42194.1 hypothetical protein PBI_MRMAGOO_91 [Mycobacterium phage MrMagoo]ARM70269.1 hypothetical protein SEA_GARDENSALSA_91 [Mycobacterium phage GardenSalsa]
MTAQIAGFGTAIDFLPHEPVGSDWVFRNVPMDRLDEFFDYMATEDGKQIRKNVIAQWLLATGGCTVAEYNSIVREVPAP